MFTGHSLGAACATIAAARAKYFWPDVDIALITFGSPRVGDKKFVQHVNTVSRIERYVNNSDVVTMLPPRIRYRHTRGLKYINSKDRALDSPGLLYMACDRVVGRVRAIWGGLKLFVSGVFDGASDHLLWNYIRED